METALGLAQVFVSPVVGTICDRYIPEFLEKIGIKWDVNEEMEKLSVNLLTIQEVLEVLEDAEDKQTTSKLIRHWLRKLKDIAYDVEDLLDECATEALHDPESTGIIDKATMVDRIKQLIDKFDKITEQSSKFNLINNLSSTTRVVHPSCRVDPRRVTSSFPTELKVYGRDEEKECIVDRLVNNINAENLSIYAIVGIGGLGKTTLAQMVYNDNMVTSRFEIKRWVCVSENFEVESLIREIIESRSDNSSQRLDQLQRELQSILRGKRFLLILDDVWNEDEAKWERLKSSLSCGAKGSSIIVTTRSDKVASLMGSSPVAVSHPKMLSSSLMGSSPVYYPKMLSEEDCFSLFKHRAFANKDEEESYPNLESIGKDIVKKCGGVPLAAKALGGILRFKREEKEWLFVKESKLLDLPQNKEDSILPALLLSYKHLSQHLKQCFAYCSIFPKDYKLVKEVLIQLWMANSFLQQEGIMELEDIGNEIFNDLVWRGFFQEVSIDFDGNTECKMHDLIHDLACSITRDECFSVVTVGDKWVVGKHKTRHLAIGLDILASPNFSLSMIQSSLRTLLAISGLFSTRVPPPLNFSNLIYLRVLDLRGSVGLETLPESIARLKLLRYLDLSYTPIALLSDEAFGNLINLQTLKLISCFNLETLPGNLRKLTNLRHLDITRSTEMLQGMPVGMGQLKCLNKLSNFIVSEDCGVGELGELDHLRGTLDITCLSKVKDVSDAKKAKLSRKKNIRVLRLDWLPAESQTNNMTDKLIADVANALQPHSNIEWLAFNNYGGSDFPMWMNSTCLFSLEKLELIDCSKCKHLPTLGLLPHLKYLDLICVAVECIGNEFYCDEEEGNNIMMKTQGMVLFRALEELELYHMGSLEEWKGWLSSSPSSSRMKEGEAQVSVFPVLKKLTIYNFPMLVNLPEGMQKNLTSLKFLEIGSCDGLKSLNKCLQLLTNLQELTINYCPELELLPDDFQNLVSLESLHLKNLPTLAAVPVVGSSTLETFDISFCDGLTDLPEWLTNQRLLRGLDLYGCKNLKSLPEGLQHLTALQYLYIRDCHPELHRRCKVTGEDWHKIAHIPQRIFRS